MPQRNRFTLVVCGLALLLVAGAARPALANPPSTGPEPAGPFTATSTPVRPTPTFTGTPPTVTPTGTPTRPPTHTPSRTPTPSVTGTPPNATPTPTPGGAGCWSLVSSPNPSPIYDHLLGLAAAARGDVWAVGEYANSNHLTLVEHWDGSAWTFVPSPSIDNANNMLNAVTALSSDDAWAVGNAQIIGTLAAPTLIEHWNGLQWLVVPSPNAGATVNMLSGVAARAPDDIWAVGYYEDASRTAQPLIEHWNGSAWSLVPGPPSSTPSTLNAVTVIAPDDAWAVGTQYNSGSMAPLIAHWNGTAWSIVPGADPQSSFASLSGITALAAANIWTVGSTGSGTLVEHWDGGQWTLVSSPSPGAYANGLDGVAALTATDIWAAGYSRASYGAGSQALIEHWDGASWTVSTTPYAGPYSTLAAVVALAPLDVWAAGYAIPNYQDHTLIEHYTTFCPTATATPSATPTVPTATPTPTVTGTPPTVAPTQTATHTPPPPTVTVPPPTCTATPPRPPASPTPTAPRSPTPALSLTPMPPLPSATVAATHTLPPTATSPPTGTPLQTATPPPTRTPPPAPGTPSATSSATASATPFDLGFSDVHPSDYFYEPVLYLAAHGVISGYADGTFRPYANTTRAQMVKIVVLGFALPLQTPATPTFSDVPASHPFYAYIETAAASNIVSGYADGTFRPYANVTRGQLSKIDVVAAGWPLLNPPAAMFTDVPVGSAFYQFVETAVCRSIVSGYGDGTFRPSADATRGQIAKIVYLSLTASHGCVQQR